MKKFTLGTETIKEKFLLNTQCALLDFSTASFFDSDTGHIVVNGGLPQLSGFVGPGNSFKSKLMNFYVMSIYRLIIESGLETQIFTEDTEVNMSLAHLAHLFSIILNRNVDVPEIKEFWSITDKTIHAGDEWVRLLRDLGLTIIKEDKQIKWHFYTRKGIEHFDYIPRLVTLDSLTELEPAVTEKMIADSTKEDSSTNMVHMKKGLFKTKFISELPKLVTKPNLRFLTTAHLGSKIEMDPNAKYKQPTKDLMFLKEGEVIKGVSSKFLFLMSIVFSSSKSQKLINRADKGPKYPASDSVNSEVDLQVVHLQILRNKHGSSGNILPIIVSQYDGVQASLTDFDYIAEDKFGFEGNNINYRLAMLPDVALGRTKIRPLINTHGKKLLTAIYYTAALKMLKLNHMAIATSDLFLEPSEIVLKLSEQGYSIDKILELGRPTATITEVGNYVSVMDLLHIAQGTSKIPKEELEKYKK